MTIRPSEIQITKVSDATSPLLSSEGDGLLLPAVQTAADGSVRSDEGPEESIAFVFGKMDDGLLLPAVQEEADGSVRSDEGPEESITFVYGRMGAQALDDLAVDPNNPNTEWPIGPIPSLETVTIVHDDYWL